MVDWRMQGQQMAICSCSWGCPCQFNSPPTNGYCHAGLAAHIDRGQFRAGLARRTELCHAVSIGRVRYTWAMASTTVPFIEERATPEQRTAIVTDLPEGSRYPVRTSSACTHPP